VAVGLFGLIVVMFGLAVVIFHIWAIVDVLRTPADVWETAKQNQVLWAAVVLLVSLLGPILYLMIARPQLLEANARLSVT
jgi:DMSO/TMAO reductase YedYZ heme-binding membrane subunit